MKKLILTMLPVFACLLFMGCNEEVETETGSSGAPEATDADGHAAGANEHGASDDGDADAGGTDEGGADEGGTDEGGTDDDGT